MITYLMLKSLGRRWLFAGLVCVVLLTGLLMSPPASAQTIYNELTVGPPYDSAFQGNNSSDDGCDWNIRVNRRYAHASTDGTVRLMLEGYLEPSGWCGVASLSQDAWGGIYKGGIVCVNGGNYTVTVTGHLSGLIGIKTQLTATSYMNTAVELEVRDSVNTLVYSDGSNLHWLAAVDAFSQTIVDSTTAAPVGATFTGVNLPKSGTYTCKIKLKSHQIIWTEYAYPLIKPLKVWSAIQFAPPGVIPSPYGPWSWNPEGGITVEEITFTDESPDYSPPVTTVQAQTVVNPCGKLITLIRTDGADGYGVDYTMYRIGSGAWTTYTGSFWMPYSKTLEYYSVDILGNTESTKTYTSPDYIPLPAPVASCQAGMDYIDLSWSAVSGSLRYYIFRDGQYLATSYSLNYRDNNPGTVQRCYTVHAQDYCTLGYPSASVCGKIPSVKLVSGSLNGTGVVDNILEISVDPGDPIQGTVVVETHNNAPPINTAPLAMVWGWGSHATSYATAQGHVMNGTRQFSVPISLVAPIPPGDYYISLAYALEMNAANVASLCNWQVPGSPHWNDSKDMADWGTTEYEQSVLEHQVTTPYEGIGGWSDRKVAAAMIKITVNEKPPYVKLHSGALNGHPVTGGVLEFSVHAGTPITGTLNLATFNPFDPGNVAPLVAVRGWGDHAAGYQAVNSWVSYGFSQYSATLNLTAPWEGGVYYISFAYALEMAGHHVASLCNWQVPGAPHWGDEKDMADWDAAQYGQAKSGDLVTTPYEGPSGWHDAQIPADMVKVTVIPRGSIAGTVTETTGENLHGVTVDLYDGAGTTLLATTVTDGGGVYRFDDLIAVDYHVSIVTPLGYLADAETKGVTVMPGEESLVDFVLARRDIVSAQQGLGYWKHHANLALTDPNAQEISFDSLCHYLELIHIHFNGNLEYPVTAYVYDDQESCVDNLQILTESLNLHLNAEPEITDPVNSGEVGAILKPNPDGPVLTMQDRAIQQFIPMLLNVASSKLATFDVASDDGMTVSQAITHCDQLITDPAMVIQLTINGETIMPGVDYDIRVNHELAKDIAERVNLGLPIPVGVIPGSTPNIAYRLDETQEPTVPNEYFLSQNHPNPFNPYTLIRFELPRAANVSLEVFNVAGQRIASLCSQYLEAGRYTFEWDGRDNDGRTVASGVYFYRVRTPDFTESRKMVLLK